MTSLVLLFAFFVFVLSAVAVAGYFLYGRKGVSDTEGREFSSGILIGDPRATDSGLRRYLLDLFQRLGEMMPASEASRNLMRKRLSHAGYRTPDALSVLFGAKCVAGVTMAIALFAIATQTRDDGGMIFSATVCGLGIGFLVPDRILRAWVKSRHGRLRRSLPPALDLIVMSLEAGQPLDHALYLASRGLEKFAPELASEFATVYLETRASKGRAEAIQYLGERNGEPELEKFCNLLLDADRFGSSLAPTLRQHAKYLRIRFRQKAQESARKLTVKLVFPLFFFIFPAILVVTLGPAVLMLMKNFKAF